MPPTTRSATRKVLTAPANPSTLQQEATHISPSNPPSEPCYLVDKMPVEVLEMICNFFYRGVKARREVRKKSEEPADPIEPSQNTSLLRTCKQTNAIAGKSMRNHVTLQIDNIQHMLQILRPMSKEHASQLRYMEINSRVIQLWYGVKTQDTSNWDRFLKCTEMLNLEWLVIDNVEHSFGRPRGKKDSHHPVLAHVPSQWKTSYILWDKWTMFDYGAGEDWNSTITQRISKSGIEFRRINSELNSHLDVVIENAVKNCETSRAVDMEREL